MLDGPRLGLAIIARDDASYLPGLLASVEGAFDRVVLLDTGSEDDTVEVFTAWARAEAAAVNEERTFTYEVGHFEWVKDFGAARQAADDLLMYGLIGGNLRDRPEPLVDWTCWADCDDEIVNAHELRRLAAECPPEASGYMFVYDYARSGDVVVCQLKRERLIRAGHGVWGGRVHEGQVLRGPMVEVPHEVAYWNHLRRHGSGEKDTRRNLDILAKWHEDEPDNTRVVAYLGSEHAAHGEHEVAVGWFDRYFELTQDTTDEWAQLHRKAANSLMILERWEDARQHGLRQLEVRPDWPDAFMTLGECALAGNRWGDVATFAAMAEQLGTPHTFMILNPLDYVQAPLILRAQALAAQGHHQPAIELMEIAGQRGPLAPHAIQALAEWQAAAQREQTADTYVIACRQLIQHDEQLKALGVLDCAPAFAIDHPKIVAARRDLRLRMGWASNPDDMAEHYVNGGSKPEDFVDLERAEAICPQLGRARLALSHLEALAA